MFDSHAHLNSEKFEGRYLENAKSVMEKVEYVVIPAWDYQSSLKALEIADTNNNIFIYFDIIITIYVALGLHPTEVPRFLDEAKRNKMSFEEYIEQELDKIEKLILENRKKVVAIGELGLDYYWDKEEYTQTLQRYMMIKQIGLANKLGLPIVIHTRDATIDMIKLLKENEVLKKGIMHCVPINEYLIKETLKLGYYISFAGNITFKNAKPEECVKIVPLDRMLVETDTPYLTPEPMRGKENTPSNVKYVIEKISKIINKKPSEIEEITTINAKRIYNI